MIPPVQCRGPRRRASLNRLDRPATQLGCAVRATRLAARLCRARAPRGVDRSSERRARTVPSGNWRECPRPPLRRDAQLDRRRARIRSKLECVCVCGGAVCWLARLHHLITLLPRAPCVLRQCYLGKWFSIQHNVDKRDSFGGGNGMIFSLLLHQSVANHQYVEATYIPAVLSIDFPYYSSANFTHIVHKRWVEKNVPILFRCKLHILFTNDGSEKML
jgi:hypothetical protein